MGGAPPFLLVSNGGAEQPGKVDSLATWPIFLASGYQMAFFDPHTCRAVLAAVLVFCVLYSLGIWLSIPRSRILSYLFFLLVANWFPGFVLGVF